MPRYHAAGEHVIVRLIHETTTPGKIVLAEGADKGVKRGHVLSAGSGAMLYGARADMPQWITDAVGTDTVVIIDPYAGRKIDFFDQDILSVKFGDIIGTVEFDKE